MAVRENRDDEYRNNDHRNRKEHKDTNWWPLLLIPLALFIGWAGRDALGRANQNNSAQYGVGGGPGTSTPCVSPSTGAGSQ